MRTFTLALVVTLALPSLLSAQTLEKIANSGELVIGFRTDAAPLSFLADNAPQGYTVDVCLALAPKIATAAGLENMDVVLEPVTPENRFEKVVDRDIDLLCGAATITLERRKSVDFSEPVYVDGSTLAIRRGGPSTFDALTGRKIGVRSSTTTFEALTNSLQAQGVNAEVIQFDDHPSGMAALKGELIDAYFADQSILMNMVMNQSDLTAYQVLDGILTGLSVRMRTCAARKSVSFATGCWQRQLSTQDNRRRFCCVCGANREPTSYAAIKARDGSA